MVSLVASVATADNLSAYAPAAYVPAFISPPERFDPEVSALCRQAGDAATPRPSTLRQTGKLLILEGGDHRSLSVDDRGRLVLHCVNRWFTARWQPVNH